MNVIETQLKKIEDIIGFELPEYFKQFYKKYIGGKIDKYQFMTLDEIINEISECYEDEEEDETLEVKPENAIKKMMYLKERLPFMQDYGGNFIGIDFAPGTTGVVGQIINYGRDEYEMFVFANSFKDFIEGIFSLKGYEKSLEIPEGYEENPLHLIDYLNEKNINFIKPVSENEIPKKIKKDDSQTVNIEEPKLNIFEKEINFAQESLKSIIDMCAELKNNIRKNANVSKLKPIFEDYRIKNYRDSLSRTMTDSESFWQKLEEYPKEGIKGYSIYILMEIEETSGDIKKSGRESIFTDIDKNKVSIKYKSTVENQEFKDTYQKLCEIFEKM